jgi:tRNA(fMet)-specific endonuclease VapC
MKPSLVDTDILSFFFRGEPSVVARFDAYTAEYGRINFSIVTYYEVLSGLKHRDAREQLASFLELASYSEILPLTKQSVSLSAEFYADLRTQGTPVDDIDLLIAGIALANNLILVTHNVKHFDRIEGLEVTDWSE